MDRRCGPRNLIPVLLALVATCGCLENPAPRNAAAAAVMRVPALGFTMTLPEGWQQGKPAVAATRKYRVDPTGRSCFLDAGQSYPFGAVRDFELDASTSLAEYVHTPPGLHGKAMSEVTRTICGLEAIEIVGEGLGEKSAPVLGVHEYIRKGNTVILVSFWARKGDFVNHETAIRQALETIRIE